MHYNPGSDVICQHALLKTTQLRWSSLQMFNPPPDLVHSWLN